MDKTNGEIIRFDNSLYCDNALPLIRVVHKIYEKIIQDVTINIKSKSDFKRHFFDTHKVLEFHKDKLYQLKFNFSGESTDNICDIELEEFLNHNEYKPVYYCGKVIGMSNGKEIKVIDKNFDMKRIYGLSERSIGDVSDNKIFNKQVCDYTLLP